MRCAGIVSGESCLALLSGHKTTHTGGYRSWQIKHFCCKCWLVEVESNFNLHAAIDRFAAGATAGRIFQFFTCERAFSSKPSPGPLITTGLITRPSAVTV